MFEVYKKESLGHADYGWLKPRYHFSFANYYDKNKTGLKHLRVLNDDLILPHSGFDTHPHNDMEIVTYVIKGVLTHTDSMGNERTISRGSIQYMSAGTGVTHSEYNNGSEILRLIQIWIYPDKKHLIPNYGDKEFLKDDMRNKFLHIVSGKRRSGSININQDANIFVTDLDAGIKTSFEIGSYDYLYVVQLEGSSMINDILIDEGDAVSTSKSITIETITKSHIMIIQL